MFPIKPVYSLISETEVEIAYTTFWLISMDSPFINISGIDRKNVISSIKCRLTVFTATVTVRQELFLFFSINVKLVIWNSFVKWCTFGMVKAM